MLLLAAARWLTPWADVFGYQTSNAFRKHYIGKMDDDWDRAKRDILERVGFRSGSKGLNSAFAATSSAAAAAAMASPGKVRPSLPRFVPCHLWLLTHWLYRPLRRSMRWRCLRRR